MKKPKYFFILKGYPRLSESFVAQEIHLLEQRGYDITILAMRKPREELRQPVVAKITAKTIYIPEYIRPNLLIVLKSNFKAFFKFPKTYPVYFFKALLKSIEQRQKDHLKRLLQAGWCLDTCDFKEDGLHIHSHFVHTPTTMAYYLHKITGIKFSISAHAKDIYTIDSNELSRKVNAAEFLTTCTHFNVEYIRQIVADPEKVRLAYHGIDTQYFSPTQINCLEHKDPYLFCTISRIVKKKGYDTVLRALDIVKRQGVRFRYDIYGTGDLDEKIKALAVELGLEDSVVFHGAQSQSGLVERLKQKGLFLCGSRISDDGDRDGIPNAMAEAMSMELAVVATRVSGIPELVENGQSGLLVEPNDPEALAGAILKLIRNPDYTEQLSKNGRKRVLEVFDSLNCVNHLCESFDLIQKDVSEAHA